MLTKSEITYFKNHKSEITPELLDVLRFSNEGKLQALEILETPKNDENFYIDAYGNPISYNGDRALKKAFTQLELSKIHEIEIEKCMNDIFYFLDFYVRILTPKGVDFPEVRQYQRDFLNVISPIENENIIATMPRQCISKDCKIKVNGIETDIESFYNSFTKANQIADLKYIESKYPKNKFIETDIGNIKILAIHKTVPLKMIVLKTKSFELKCAENHIIIDKDYNEIQAKNSLNKKIITKNGIETVTDVIFLNCFENCYDLELENHHLYYSNGILSHNSGKSVTVGIFLAHCFLFKKDINIGILANKGSMAREFLDKVKKILVNLPIWLQTGIVTWNKGSIEGESNIRILTDTPSDSSFRGFSTHYIVFDESAWVDSSTFNDVIDSLLPSQSGLSTKKVIFISTPNGKNHFYDIWKRAGFTSKESQNGYIKYFGDWKAVPRFRSDGSKYEAQEFKKEIIKKYGERYFAVNYACEFQGSANTLISGEILDSFVICDALYTRKPNIAIFEDPIPNTKYVMGVDSAKSGGDFCAFQVLKIENTGFTQVARCKCQIDYLKFVDYIVDYGKSYNNAMLIVENNDGSGQSIADFIKSGYDYANLYHDINKINGKRFKYPGFRTTYKTRYALLQNMKMFAESNKLKIVDSDTIKELFDFVEINGKYQAEAGKHDDLVMSLAICFAIFLNAKNLDNIQEIIKSINTETEFKNDFIKDKYLSIDYSKDIIKQLRDIRDSETALGFGADF